MDKLQALYKSRNHWALLSITGSKSKRSYEPAKNWYETCAVCEQAYDSNLKKARCDLCALTGYGWNSRKPSLSSYCATNGFYVEWCKTTSPKKRKYWAYRMVQACNRAIEDLLFK